MEENLGREKHGRKRNAHDSTRRELAANTPPPRERGRPRRGTHDDEASSSGSQAQVQIPPELEYVEDEYINGEAKWPQIPPLQQQPQEEESEQGYEGVSTYLSLVPLYHKHRAVKILDEEEFPLKRKVDSKLYVDNTTTITKEHCEQNMDWFNVEPVNNMPNSHKKYDVFISFRGEDTRSGFVSHLHEALRRTNIETFIDYHIVKGHEVGTAIAKAIKDSHMSIVVLSENYATSKWCLDELLHILKCRELHGQVVIPVFYKTDPSHVRKQTGSYKMAFAKHERHFAINERNRHKLSEWKDALTRVANICGWDSRNSGTESDVLKNIVKDVSQKLAVMYPNELKDLVKVDENSEHIELLLKTKSRIGIWGMGGTGKTTIAKQIFAKNVAHYDNVCFLEKVSEESDKHVRDKLLSMLLKREITASEVHGQHTFIKRRLSGTKSLIVLDDVDNATQLDDLCGVLNDLGPDSKLIITTRDKHILGGNVDEIYEVTPWKLKDSLKLFSLGAFKQSHPRKGYERISERAVKYAGGVPLALKVLGSHFRSRKPKFWESELDLYENKGEPFPDIQKVLKLSYNGLSWRQKEMFLDIAFFFKDENKDIVTRILDAFGFYATSGLEILEDKALISISNSNRIQMHSLLQKMAFDIVQHEHNKDPGKHSRLRDAQDISDVLGNNKGSDAIEGIIFDLSQKLDIHVQADTFNLMTKLRFLKFHIPPGKKKLGNVHLPENIMPFFDKLTYLEWNGYPLKSLPQPFRAEKLIQICLPHSNIEHLWYGKQELVNLEAIDLSECKQLINLPDLSGALKLKHLRLSGCENLCEVQASAFSKDTLDTLLLDRCTKLESLMGEKHLKSLANFSVKGCSSLKEFSLSSDSIKRLDLSNTGIEILHSSIGGMNKLSWLNLEGLNLTNLPNELSCLRSLTELLVSKCSVVTKSNLEPLFDGLESLTLLHLKDCCNLLELPANISSLSSLHELRLDGSSVEELPDSIKSLSKLEVLSLHKCSKLRCLPELPSSIKEFQADNCTSLMKVSTLKTFSIIMIGKKKCISLKNTIQLEVDGPSLDCITEDAVLTMESAAFHNVLVRKYRFQSYNYNSAEVCLPGHRVPRQFEHRSTTYSSVTINVSNSLGFIFAVVVSPSYCTQQHGYFFEILCQCYSENGKRKLGLESRWNHKPTMNLSMDHVFVWYDPYHSDSILSSKERKISFEFCITTYTSSGRELSGLLSIKECGVCPIYYSEKQNVLGTGNLDKKLELELYEQIQFESRSGAEGYDEQEGAVIQNQQSELNENLHSSYECLIVSNDNQVYENLQEKENWDDDDDDNSNELMKSKILHESSTKSGKETETSSHTQEQFKKEEDSTARGSDVDSYLSKAIKIIESSCDDESHTSTSPTRLNLTSKAKTDEETKNLQQSPPSSVKNIEIPSHSYTNKLNPNSPMIAESSSSKPSSSKGPIRSTEEDSSKLKKLSTPYPEYSLVDFSEYKRILEEDPLAIMEKLLSGELGHSSLASQCTTQAEATETQRDSIETLLDDLRQLAFSKNLLKNLPNDVGVTLGEEVKDLLAKLNDRANELSEKQSSGIADFTTIFKEAITNIDEGKLTSVTLQQLALNHKDSMSTLQESQNKIMKFEESIIAGEDKIKAMDGEIEDIKAQIRLLEEKARKVQQAKSQLEEACLKCKEKRSETVEEVKNAASKTIETCEKINNVKKKKWELDSKYEMLEKYYAMMKISPPF